MISMKKKRALRSALAITICTVTIASVNTPVYSAPSTDELESTTSGLKGELNDLNSQLSSLSKELDNTSSQIEDLSAKVEKSKLDLASAQLDEEAQYETESNSCMKAAAHLWFRFFLLQKVWEIS